MGEQMKKVISILNIVGFAVGLALLFPYPELALIAWALPAGAAAGDALIELLYD